MPELPHGWRMKNSSVELAGPPLEDDNGSDTGSDALDIEPDSEGWDDVEDDTESISVRCLGCEKNFPAVKAMLGHCTETHGFDLQQVRQAHGLDFYSTIKLVNYIRGTTQAGQSLPNTTDPSLWADDKYLQPVIEDDALLFGLDDIGDAPIDVESASEPANAT